METTMSEIQNTVDGNNVRLEIAEKRLVNLKTQFYKLHKVKHTEKKDLKKHSSLVNWGTTSNSQIASTIKPPRKIKKGN